MKKRPRIHPRIKKTKPDILPPINVIIETKKEDNRIFTDDASLYQAILSYALNHTNSEYEFRFTEMGKWLLKNLPEFVNFYTDSKANETFSSRLANRRDRIQERIDHLIKMEFIYIKKYVPGIKNTKEKVPVYALTIEGKFLLNIIKARDTNKTYDLMWLIKYEYNEKTGELQLKSNNNPIDEKRSNNIRQIFEIVNQFLHIKESYILSFLSIFFKKCFINNFFGDIIDLFYYSSLRYIKINKGQELIRLFTKVNHPLQWIFAYPNLFVETLNEMDHETRRMILFKFKMEIEEYYDLYYLASYPRRQTYSELHSIDSYYNYDMAITGTEWQSLRFNNINNYLAISIPGQCSRCKSEQPFIMNIEEYLDNLKEFSNEDLQRENILSLCTKCNIKSVLGKIYLPLNMVKGHEMI